MDFRYLIVVLGPLFGAIVAMFARNLAKHRREMLARHDNDKMKSTKDVDGE